MRKLVLLGAAALVGACNASEAPPADNVAVEENLAVESNMANANMAAPATMSMLNTTWEWTDDGKKMVGSVDSTGAYIVEADGAHLDHGTYALKDGKDCFTSAMGDKTTDCWSPIAGTPGGGTATSTSDKGQTGTYTRVEYRALKMPG